MNAQVFVAVQQIPHCVGDSPDADLQRRAVGNPVGDQLCRLIISLIKNFFLRGCVQLRLLLKDCSHLTDMDLVALSQNPRQPGVDLNYDPLRHLNADGVA